MPVHNALFVSELIKFNLNLTKVLRSTVVDDTPRSTNSLENTLRTSSLENTFRASSLENTLRTSALENTFKTSSLENTFSCIKGTPNRLLAHTPFVARKPYVGGRGNGREGDKYICRKSRHTAGVDRVTI